MRDVLKLYTLERYNFKNKYAVRTQRKGRRRRVRRDQNFCSEYSCPARIILTCDQECVQGTIGYHARPSYLTFELVHVFISGEKRTDAHIDTFISSAQYLRCWHIQEA